MRVTSLVVEELTDGGERGFEGGGEEGDLRVARVDYGSWSGGGSGDTIQEDLTLHNGGAGDDLSHLW